MAKLKLWWTGIAAAALLATGTAQAAESGEMRQFQFGPVQIAVSATADVEHEAAKPSEHWLGVGCVPVPPPVRDQLGLPEGQGLLVMSVYPESPAQKAGVREHDVLTKAGDKKLGTVPDLIQAVESGKGKKLTLDVVRGGKHLQVGVVPAPRPEHAQGLSRDDDSDWRTLHRWFEQVAPGEEGHGPMHFRLFGPGAILPPNPPLPGNVTVSITRTGSEPAKIVVQQGDKKWEVTEKELDKLPADVRPHVERMLHGPLAVRMFEGVTPKVQQDLLGGEGRSGARVERRLEEMSRKLDDLRRQVDELRAKTDKTPEKPKAEGRRGERI